MAATQMSQKNMSDEEELQSSSADIYRNSKLWLLMFLTRLNLDGHFLGVVKKISFPPLRSIKRILLLYE